MATPETSTGNSGIATVAPVACGNTSGQAPVNPPPRPAHVSVPLFGGYVGGRPRKDGLKPGSPEAIAADREKDRLRKARRAAAEKAVLEASKPLPAATPGQPGAAPSPVPGVATVPSALAGQAGPIPWEATQLRPLFDQLLPAVEALTVRQVVDRAEKAKLPAAVVREVEKDCAWNEASKKALAVSTPQVAAKWLNKSGISAENQPELVMGTAIAGIVVGHTRVFKRLDKIIASQVAEQNSHQKTGEQVTAK